MLPTFVVSIFLLSESALLKPFGISIPEAILLLYILSRFYQVSDPNYRDLRVKYLIFISIISISFVANLIIRYDQLAQPGLEWATGINSPMNRAPATFLRACLYAIGSYYIATDNQRSWTKALNIYCRCSSLVAAILVLQYLLFKLFNIEVLYAYELLSNMPRFGAHIGEPSTAASLIFPTLFLKYNYQRSSIWNLTNNGYFGLHLLGLLAAFSTSIVLSLLICAIIFSRLSIMTLSFRYSAVAVAVFFSGMSEKVMGEMLGFGSRSITIYLGFKIFLDNLLLGVGLGNSPFYMTHYLDIDRNAGIFEAFISPMLLRTVAMNSAIQLFSELGLIGLSIVCFFVVSLFRRTSGNGFIRRIVIVFALYSNSVPGAYFNPAFLFFASLWIRALYHENRSNVKETLKATW